MEIKEKKEQPLLSRTEITAFVSYEGATPSRTDLKKQLASLVKVDEKLIVIRTIDVAYGETTAKIFAYAYKNEEDMKRIETENALKKGAPKEEKKEKAPAEAKPEEKPAEKPTEAKPEEKKEEGKE